MASTEMYDKLATVTPDADQTLSLSCQGEISEEGGFTQEVHAGDDGSEERVNLGSTAPIFYATFNFNQLTESDMGTVFDLCFDSAKAFGMVNSFKWSKRGDGHTYVVRFATELFNRTGNAQSRMGAKQLKLRIIGRIADA